MNSQRPQQPDDEARSNSAAPTASERLLAWAAGLPPAGLESTERYRRYSELLPEALAGMLAPGSPELAEFESFIDEWDDEYAELRETLDAARREKPHSSDDQPAQSAAKQQSERAMLIDLAVLRNSPSDIRTVLRRAQEVWLAELRPKAAVQRIAGAALLQFPFTATVQQSEMETLFQISGTGDDPLRDILVATVPVEQDSGVSTKYEVIIQVERKTATVCTLLVGVRGPQVASAENLRVTATRPGKPELNATPDEQGTATFVDLPIEDLAVLTVTVSVPLPPA